nr:unnamed protein product [Digitaria exilis]
MRCAPPPAAAAWRPAHGLEGSAAARPGSCAPELGSRALARADDAGRGGFAGMWLFWRARNRFSLEELRYLTDQLQKVYVVNEANKDFVIEALRSIAELMIYGDQHDPSFFENANSSPPLSSVEDAIVQIEDTLYYFSDVMSSGIPDLEKFITENILQVLVFRLLLPSLQRQNTDLDISVTTSMYLLCCILHIFKNKDMASTVAAALFHQSDCPDRKQGTPNGYTSEHDHCISENQCSSASAVEKENEDKATSLSAEALVGEDLAERQLFSSSSGLTDDSICSDFDIYVRKLQDSHKDCSAKLSEESEGSWCDMLLPIVKEAWRNCKKAIEASSPPKGSKSIIVPMDLYSFGGDSSLAIAERVYEMVKPRIDEKHEKWLHLRIRPSTLPFLDSEKHKGKTKKYLVDGRWTLAFSDEQSCKAAETMVIEEMKLQQDAVGKQLQPLVEFDMPEDGLPHPQPPSHETPSDDG